VIFGATAKELRRALISPPITTRGSHPQVKGGGSHHTIVRTTATDDGQAAAEYAVILALVVAGGIAAYQVFGDWVVGLYDQVVTSFT
jgi:Flp pilus assembly pilin Flp